MKISKLFLIIIIISLVTLNIYPVFADRYDDFSQADYDRALKGDKNLQRAQLEKADLKGIDLSGADLQKADLEDANLQGADLTNANLKGADLEGANLKGAKIQGANFRAAELEYTIWVNGRVCGNNSIGSCR